MANEPKQPSQQIEQPPTKAVKEDENKNASADKKSEADKLKSPGEGI